MSFRIYVVRDHGLLDKDIEMARIVQVSAQTHRYISRRAGTTRYRTNGYGMGFAYVMVANHILLRGHYMAKFHITTRPDGKTCEAVEVLEPIVHEVAVPDRDEKRITNHAPFTSDQDERRLANRTRERDL